MNLSSLKKAVSTSVVLSMVISCLIISPAAVSADELSPDDLIPANDDQFEIICEDETVVPSEDEEIITNEIPEDEISETEETISEEVISENEVIESDEEIVENIDDENTDAESTDENSEDTEEFDDELVLSEMTHDEINENLSSDDTDTYTVDGIDYVDTGISDAALTDIAYCPPHEFSDMDTVIYNRLSDQFAQIANGTVSSTKIPIPVSSLTSKTTWTAEELGVSSTRIGNYINNTAYARILAQLMGDDSAILCTLKLNEPQNAYWYNTTVAPSFLLDGVTAPADGSSITIKGSLYYYLEVCRCYQGGNKYTVSPDAVIRAQEALANAQAIVDRAAGLYDAEKLYAYKNEICNLVSYDRNAETNNVPYGEACQFLYVFDNDPDTNVICEGYAKAFKILCDMTNFTTDVSCILATGYLTCPTAEGNHMWNVVNIYGNNYMVDVTNCDSCTYGEGEYLFLKAPTSGTYMDAYEFEGLNSSILTYAYDKATFIRYDYDRLTISNSSIALAYAKNAPDLKTGWIHDDIGWWYRYPSGNCPKSCWLKLNNHWYYFKATGYMATGWVNIENDWYYMDSSGVMQTGWVQVNGTWYYFNNQGVMQTGWQLIDGTWYYLNTSGAMKTGWVKQSNNWYYLDTSGKMATGWKYINGKWYYFYSSGKMAYNTTIGGYQLSSSGAMI